MWANTTLTMISLFSGIWANTTLTVISLFSGIKHLKSQSDSAFPEEEEGVSEREEEWGH